MSLFSATVVSNREVTILVFLKALNFLNEHVYWLPRGFISSLDLALLNPSLKLR